MPLRSTIYSGGFGLVAELPAVADAKVLLDAAAPLAGWVDSIHVGEGPANRPHLSPLIAAGTLLRAGYDPLLQLTCRDRNRVALQGDLLGAANLGVETLLITRGNRMRTAMQSPGEGVFELGATDLITAARAIADTESPRQFGVQQAPDFFVGGAVMVFDAANDWYPRAPLAKIDAGAQFLLSQPCFDIAILRRYMDRLVAAGIPRRAHLLVSIAALPSIDVARRMRDSLRGVRIPDAIMQRLKEATDPEAVGVEICAELLQALTAVPGVSGAHLMSAGSPALTRAAIEASGVRKVRPEPA
jgi:methylenetetrahydrofolate reductase (NADPH)